MNSLAGQNKCSLWMKYQIMGDRLVGRSLAFEVRAGRFEPYSPKSSVHCNYKGEGLKAKESESALHCRLLGERDEDMRQRGRKEVVEWLERCKKIKVPKYQLKEWGL